MKLTGRQKQIIDSYLRLKSIWKVGEELGVCGQTVHEVLVRAKIPRQKPQITLQEKWVIIDHYQQCASGLRGDLNLGLLQKKLPHRSTAWLCRQAKYLGLTSCERKLNKGLKTNSSLRIKRWFKENAHPKGMLGKKHNDNTKLFISKASRSSWSKKTPEQIAACSQKTLKTKLKKYGSVAPPRHKVTWKGGWREIGGRRIYFRSRWEANYARILEYKKNLGEIKDWEFEPDTFWFDKIKRGVVCYIPDFKITETDGSFYYIEIKGWMDARSKTKLKRMKKYHPNIRLILIEAKAYKDCLILYSTKIKNFE